MEANTSSNSWIRLKDFTESKFWISVTNSTTQTQVKTEEIEIAELSEQGLTLKLPVGTCAQGHLLAFDIVQRETVLGAKPKLVVKPGPGKKVDDSDAKFKVSATGKVTQVDKFDGKWNLVAIKFYQVDAKVWKEFLDQFTERQDKMQKVLKQIRD